MKPYQFNVMFFILFFCGVLRTQAQDTVHVYSNSVILPTDGLHDPTGDFDPKVWIFEMHCHVDTLWIHGNNYDVYDAIMVEVLNLDGSWSVKLMPIWIGGYGQPYSLMNNGLTPGTAIQGPVNVYGNNAAPPLIEPVGSFSGIYNLYAPDMINYDIVRVTGLNNPDFPTLWDTEVTPLNPECTEYDVVDPGPCQEASLCLSIEIDSLGQDCSAAYAELAYVLNGTLDTVSFQNLLNNDTVCILTYGVNDTVEVINFTHGIESGGNLDCGGTAGQIFTTLGDLSGDTTYLFGNTCVLDSVGEYIEHHLMDSGCDSVVITAYVYQGIDIVIDAPSAKCPEEFAVLSTFCAGCSYLWSTGETVNDIATLDPGEYSVTATNSFGCTATDIASLSNYEPATVYIEGEDDLCAGETLDLSVSQEDFSEVRWYHNGSIFSQSQNIYITDIPVEYSGEYIYTALDINACEIADTVEVIVHPLPEVSIDDIHVCEEDQLVISVDHEPGDIAYAVSGPLAFTGTDTSYAVTTTDSGNYFVFASDQVSGCTNEDDFSVDVFICCAESIFVPNAFTPDGDGLNDNLMVQYGEGVQEISRFSIYNRWGNEVFRSTNTLFGSWDGTYKGQPVQAGVYVVLVQWICGTGKERLYKGDVTVVRK